MSALDKQVAGGHYKGKAIQPVEYIHANGLDFCEGNVVKYVTRWKDKNGIGDLEKAKHYIELLIELETKKQAEAEKKRIEDHIKVSEQAKSIRDQFDPFSREYWAAPEPTIKAYMEHDGPGGLMTNRGFGPISTASITGR